MNLEQAAVFINDQKALTTFNIAIYEVRYDGLDSIVPHSVEEFATEMRLKDYAHRPRADVRDARVKRDIRSAQYSERAVPSPSSELSLDNRSRRNGHIEKDYPFIETELRSVALKCQSRIKDNAFQKVASLYRFILQSITDPPDFVEEMLGYGWKEVQNGQAEEGNESRSPSKL
ncbi:hypothetical protein Aduo_005419 [Ancylostoma duodenale]